VSRAQLEQWLDRIDGSPFTSRVTLPAELVLGFWVAPLPALRLEANLVNTHWSSYEASLEGHVVDGQSTGSMQLSLGWKDTFAVRLAVEGDLSPSVTLGAGYAWEPSPIPESTWRTPFAFRGDASVYGLGVTLRRAALSVDLGVSWHRYATVESAVVHPRFGRRHSTFASDARLAALSLRHRF
jgi:long-chain fatty acid transport protein